MTRIADTTRRRVALLAALFIAMGAVQVLPNSAEAAMNPVPALTITLEPSSQEARVSEGGSGSIQFTGSVKVDKLPADRMFVQLSSSVDAGWYSQCSPNSIVLTDTKAQSFSVSAVVPAGTPSNIVGTLRVDAKGSCGGFISTGRAEAIITVKPYYRVMITSNATFKEITPGTQAFYSFKVWNVGNSMDSYEIEIVNLKELVDKGWTITGPCCQVAKINPNEYKTVRITAQSPRYWVLLKSETTIIALKASSLNAKEEQKVTSDSIQFLVHEEGSYLGLSDFDDDPPPMDPAYAIPSLSFAMLLWTAIAVMLTEFIGRKACKGRRRARASWKKGDL